PKFFPCLMAILYRPFRESGTWPLPLHSPRWMRISLPAAAATTERYGYGMSATASVWENRSLDKGLLHGRLPLPKTTPIHLRLAPNELRTRQTTMDHLVK